jgi:hypothetical protein
MYASPEVEVNMQDNLNGSNGIKTRMVQMQVGVVHSTVSV